jgi:hypothetical protein
MLPDPGTGVPRTSVETNKVRQTALQDPGHGLMNVRLADSNRPSNRPSNSEVLARAPAETASGALEKDQEPLDPEYERLLIEDLNWMNEELEAGDNFVPTILDHFWFGKTEHAEWRGLLTIDLIDEAFEKAQLADENPSGFFFYCLRDHFNGYGL